MSQDCFTGYVSWKGTEIDISSGVLTLDILEKAAKKAIENCGKPFQPLATLHKDKNGEVIQVTIYMEGFAVCYGKGHPDFDKIVKGLEKNAKD